MRALALALAGLLTMSAVAAAPPSSSAKAPPSRQALSDAGRRVAQGSADVEHLKQDVGRQEAANQQAAERLQQQDRTIADLRRQLEATKGTPQPTGTEH